VGGHEHNYHRKQTKVFLHFIKKTCKLDGKTPKQHEGCKVLTESAVSDISVGRIKVHGDRSSESSSLEL